MVSYLGERVIYLLLKSPSIILKRIMKSFSLLRILIQVFFLWNLKKIMTIK